MQLPPLDSVHTFFNFKIAKIIATFLVFCFIVYHGILHAIDGGDSCYRLLSKGRFQGSNMWQPYGCMTHTYSTEDSRRCIRYVAFLKQDNRIAFVGDSRIRQLYYALVRQIAVSALTEEELPTGKDVYHSDMHYEEPELRLRIDFYWRTTIDSNVLSLIDKWKSPLGAAPSLVVLGSGLHYIKVFNDSLDALQDYTNNVMLLAQNVEGLQAGSHVLWMLQEPVLAERLVPHKAHITNTLIDQYNRAAMQVLSGSRVLVWSSARLIAQGSLLDFADGIHAGEATITYYIQILLNLYCNNYLNFDDGSCCNTREGFTTTQITSFVALCTCSVLMICLSLKQWLTATQRQEQQQQQQQQQQCEQYNEASGITALLSRGHQSMPSGDSDVSSTGSNSSPSHYQQQIQEQQQHDKIYHNHYVKTSTSNSVVNGSISNNTSSNIVSEGSSSSNSSSRLSSEYGELKELSTEEQIQQKEQTAKQQQLAFSQPSLQTILRALGKLGLIMGYFFLCDRTGMFMKENKYFSQLNFWFPIGYMLALGLFFTEDTSHTRLLHRDMTDEWKGWMQLVILVYHMTGSSQQLSIYLHVRILVSAYLFLTGFGHFSYAWTGRDMGLVRFCQIMFRINFLTILLCLVMNRPYQFYYFVPLVSFWYTILYITLVLPPVLLKPRANNSHLATNAPTVNYLYSIVKFVGLAGFVTVLFLSEVFFEKVFVLRPWKALFVTTDDDIHEWWFRWQLDRHSMLYGAVFALLYRAGLQYGLLDDTSGSNLVTGRLAGLLSLLAVGCVGSYTVLARFCGNKRDCNQVHPYVVWIPILGYIILRNQVGLLRTRFSSFFAWFGRISLELFVCQYHIWLAADTHGVLVLIPSYPVANVLVTSFIFLCVAQEIHEITNVLLPFFVPNHSWKAVRNLSIFLFLLLALAIHDGIF